MISIVIPIFNEQENLPELRRRLATAMDSAGEPWEAVLVDDGSRDDSPRILREFHAQDPRFKIVTLSRNFGHQPAISAGIHHAAGDAVVLIDADLQDPPEVIPEMIRKWKEGFQVVLGQRASRAEGGVRGIGFRMFYPLLRRVSDLPIAPDAGIFGLMDRAVVNEFNQLPERNRFIPGLRNWLGFRQTSVPYDRADRAAGKPKQTLGRLIRYAGDAMVSFSYKPLRPPPGSDSAPPSSPSRWRSFTSSPSSPGENKSPASRPRSSASCSSAAFSSSRSESSANTSDGFMKK